MYYVLIIRDSEAWSHDHEEYKLASKSKMLLELLKREIDYFKSSLTIDIEKIESDSYQYVGYSIWDWNYSCSKEQGLGLTEKELIQLKRKEGKSLHGYDCTNLDIYEVKKVNHLTKKERIDFLKELGFSDVAYYLEGFKSKRRAMKNGKYYYNQIKYDYYKKVYIN